MASVTQFQAYGNAGKAYGDTAKQAGAAYFEKFPKSRKCNIVQGSFDGYFFTVTYGRVSAGEWPKSYKDVTKKALQTMEG